MSLHKKLLYIQKIIYQDVLPRSRCKLPVASGHGPDDGAAIIANETIAWCSKRKSGMSAITSRRDIMKGGAAAAFALVLAPHMSLAKPAEVEAALKKLYGDKKMAKGKVTLDLPQIAENGLVVPINVSVESKMTAAEYVKAVHVFADGNPLPGVVSYRFTPESGQAAANIRMRLARTQNVIAVAEMSDGKLYTAKSEVKVTIGGCGG
jgi:sulfur-oxidizing protein SoxY